MSTEAQKDGGPAFPRLVSAPAVPAVPDVVDVDKDAGSDAIDADGITILDYFATRAMQTFLERALAANLPINHREIARQSRLMGEAMLAELGK